MRKTILSLAGSTAILLASGLSFANAADAVVAAAPEPAAGAVQICDAFGAGFFYIPGTETCLKIGGQIAVSGGYASNDLGDRGFSSVDARLDFDTKADSEVGTIGTKIRISSRGNLDQFTIGGLPNRNTDVELAYITAGPFYAGYKETLVNTAILYGDALDLETYLGDSNTTTIGALYDGIGGVYLGAGVESVNRGSGLSTETFERDGGNSPDIAARVGVANQPWGGVDLSGLYSTENESWLIKATADLTPVERLDVRLTAGYGEQDVFGFGKDNGWLLAGAAKYGFTDKISAFTGVSYIDFADQDALTANVGASYALTTGFDVKGEFAYTDASWNADKAYTSKLTFVRTW